MSLVAIPASVRAALGPSVAPAAGGTLKPASSMRTRPKMDTRSAWSTWQAGADPAAGADFLDRVSAWTEGTAAQMLRQKWPAGAPRPTAPELRERLRDQLALVAGGPVVGHVEALASAREMVVEQLRRAAARSDA